MKTNIVKLSLIASIAFTVVLSSCEKTEMLPFENDLLKKQEVENALSGSDATLMNDLYATKPYHADNPAAREYDLKRIPVDFSSSENGLSKANNHEFTDDPGSARPASLKPVEPYSDKIVRERPEWPEHTSEEKVIITKPGGEAFSDDPGSLIPNSLKPVETNSDKIVRERPEWPIYTSEEKTISFKPDADEFKPDGGSAEEDCRAMIANETARYQQIADNECKEIQFRITCYMDSHSPVIYELKVVPGSHCGLEPLETNPADR